MDNLLLIWIVTQSADEVIKILKLQYVTPAEYDAFVARTNDPESAATAAC